MSEWNKGFWAMIVVCVTWGFAPLFYRQLAAVDVLDVLANRTIWSLAFFLILLGLQGRLADLGQALTGPCLGRIAFAALTVSINWGVYIWSVQAGHVVQSSLGYYIYPLIAVLLGVVVFRERLAPMQALAVGLAVLAVLVLTWGLGVTPWVSLTLAVSFGLYGMAKKALPIAPMVSVACEVVLLLPLALGWLILQKLHLIPAPLAAPVAFGQDLGISLLLMASGLVTAVPLILFSYATQRVEMATVGLMQYLNPTLQFFCAVAIFAEPFTHWHLIAFGLIWLALGVYSASAMRQSRGGLGANG